LPSVKRGIFLLGVRQICWWKGLSNGTILPKFFSSPAEIQATEGNDGVGPSDGPLHAGLFESESNDSFAARFHHTRSHKPSLATEIRIAHALGVALKIVQVAVWHSEIWTTMETLT
jgi:hypothetical protein